MVHNEPLLSSVINPDDTINESESCTLDSQRWLSIIDSWPKGSHKADLKVDVQMSEGNFKNNEISPVFPKVSPKFTLVGN